MKRISLKLIMTVIIAFALIGTAMAYFAPTKGPSASGKGTLFVQDPDGKITKRQFSLSVSTTNGAARGNAILNNPAFTVKNGQNYQLQIDISCMNVIGNVAFFGGLTQRTNDPSLVDAVYFSVQDNGQSGVGDRISSVFFFDDDPNTQGDPGLCHGNVLGDFPMTQIATGNISIRN